MLMFAIKELDKDIEATIKTESEDSLESNLELLGVTGLEDLLQNNVAVTIKDFRLAGIKVWMLTGDKGETAENIGISCGLLDPEIHQVMKIINNNVETIQTQLKKVSSQMVMNHIQSKNTDACIMDQDTETEECKEFSLLVDGTALPVIFKDADLSDMLLTIFQHSNSVIVFRCSPDEKSQIIKFVMRNDSKAFCCAIGDGANDINMI